MTEDEMNPEGRPLNRLQQHRFMLLVGATILVALFLVSVALALYASSGAAQLDLSRPGYVSVREQVKPTDKSTDFPASGTIDQAAIDRFRVLYDKHAEQVNKVDSFSGDVMSDQTLSIDPEDQQ